MIVPGALLKDDIARLDALLSESVGADCTGAFARLTYAEANLLEALRRAAPDWLPMATMRLILSWCTTRRGPWKLATAHNVHTNVHRLRQNLDRYAVVIETHMRHGRSTLARRGHRLVVPRASFAAEAASEARDGAQGGHSRAGRLLSLAHGPSSTEGIVAGRSSEAPDPAGNFPPRP